MSRNEFKDYYNKDFNTNIKQERVIKKRKKKHDKLQCAFEWLIGTIIALVFIRVLTGISLIDYLEIIGVL